MCGEAGLTRCGKIITKLKQVFILIVLVHVKIQIFISYVNIKAVVCTINIFYKAEMKEHFVCGQV